MKISFFFFLLSFGVSIIIGQSVEQTTDSILNSLKKANLSLYFKTWDPNTRSLYEGLTPGETKGKHHFRTTFNHRGLIKAVTAVSKNGVDRWTYHLLWDKEGIKSSYKIEFHVRKPLTELHNFFFASDVSEMRPGWIAYCTFFSDGRIKSLRVKDSEGYLFYYYEFGFKPLSNNGMVVSSRYFRADSSLVGSHQLEYNSEGLLKSALYFDKDGNDARMLRYQYNDDLNEVIFSAYAHDRSLQERRIISFSNRFREHLVIKKDETGLSDVVSFMEKTTSEDIEKLAALIEQKYRMSVDYIDTTYSPINYSEIIDTVIVKQTDTVEVVKRKRFLDCRIGLGGSFLSEAYLDNQSVLCASIGFGISRPYSFIFIKKIDPRLTLSFLKNDLLNFPIVSVGFAHHVTVPAFIPFTRLRWSVPIFIDEEIGKFSDGWTVSVGLAIPYTLGLPMNSGFRGTILAFSNNLHKPTGFLEFYTSIDLHPLFRKK